MESETVEDVGDVALVETPHVAMVWEGRNVVKMSRTLLGETDPAKSMPGTVRGDFCVQVISGFIGHEFLDGDLD